MVALLATMVAASAAVVTFVLGKRQIASAQRVAQFQIESAKEVARTNLIMPMREAWIGRLREKLAWYIGECGKVYAGDKLDHDSVGVLLAGRHEILLLLDVRVKAQYELDSSLTELYSTARVKPKDQKLFREVLDRACQLAHDLLKSEWQRATAGEKPPSTRPGPPTDNSP